MRGILSLIVILPLSGCLLETAKGRASTTVVRDTSVAGVDRTETTSEYTGSAFGASVPPMMVGVGGYGYGYGYGHGYVVARPSCRLHPDECADIKQVTYVQPVTVVSNGGRGSADGGAAASVDVSELKAEIAQLQTSVKKLKGVAKMTIEQSCTIVIANAGSIPAAKRDGMVAACTKILNANPNAADKAEEN